MATTAPTTVSCEEKGRPPAQSHDLTLASAAIETTPCEDDIYEEHAPPGSIDECHQQQDEPRDDNRLPSPLLPAMALECAQEQGGATLSRGMLFGAQALEFESSHRSSFLSCAKPLEAAPLQAQQHCTHPTTQLHQLPLPLLLLLLILMHLELIVAPLSTHQSPTIAHGQASSLSPHKPSFLQDNDLGIDFLQCAKQMAGVPLDVMVHNALVLPVLDRCAVANHIFMQRFLLGEFQAVRMHLPHTARP